MPKVSVIIPTYNREGFISETIESVLSQTYKDFEIIVVDDGSKDNTLKVLEKFNSKIKIIIQSNLERAEARNNGVKNSSGDYIAFLDSDDLWEPNKLELQINAMDKNKNIILSYGSCGRINTCSKTIKPARRQLNGYSGKVFEKLLTRNFITSPTPVIRRSLFSKTEGFKTRFIPYEDWELWIRLSLLGEFYFIPSVIAKYRIHPTQSVKLTSAEKIEQVTTSIIESSINLAKVNNLTKQKSFSFANLRFCYWYLLANQNHIAKEKIKKAFNHYPRLIFNPQFYGLYLLCHMPYLKDKWIFNLEQYH